VEEDDMEAVKVFERKDTPLDWEYDDEADTLYLSFGTPRAATGVDLGQGVIVRYDEQAREVVGLTIVGVGRLLEEYVKTKP
jgi:uncharacterized protein YuzE